MRWTLLGIAVCSSLAMTSCRQDPFPQTGKILAEKPPAPMVVLPPYMLDVPDRLEFAEGQAGEYEIKANVPAPAIPLVTIYGLPEGAVYDAKSGKIKWTPGYDAANDPKDLNIVEKSYPLQIMLRSSKDNLTLVQRRTSLIVRDTPRKLEVKALTDSSRIMEGTTFVQKLKIISEDFPEGPFKIEGTALPPGAEISMSPTDSTMAEVRYTPGYDVARVDDYLYKYFANAYTVTAPRNQKATTPAAYWVVYDVRQKPRFSAPQHLVQGSEANFTVRAEDPNAETPPLVQLAETPAFGKVYLAPARDEFGVKGKVLPSSMYSVRWDQIPAEKIGETGTLKLKACTYDNARRRTNCEDASVEVKFDGTTHATPVVDRRHWPLGTIKYLRLGETVTLPMTIRDSESLSFPPTVTIPKPFDDEVKWERNRLTVTAKSVGLKQFNVHARSPFGMTSQESFILEVLPSTWSPVLILGESLSDPEASKMLGLFEDAQVINPEMQGLDGRVLAMRTTMVLTTKVLQNKKLLAQIETVAAGVQNLYVFSPLIDNFSGALRTEMTKNDLVKEGRFLRLPGSLPALGEFSVDPERGSGLSKPSDPVTLAGTTTSESPSPLVLSLGGKSNCKRLLGINKDMTKLLTTVRCERQRSNGENGVLILSGMEWADLVLSLGDAKIAKYWMNEAVKP